MYEKQIMNTVASKCSKRFLHKYRDNNNSNILIWEICPSTTTATAISGFSDAARQSFKPGTTVNATSLQQSV